MGLNAVQRSAVLTAIQKMVKSGLDGCRSKADHDMVRLYEETGADRLKVKVGDVEVGTFTLCFSKDAYEVTDAYAFKEFCLANGLADMKREIRPEVMGGVIRTLQQEDPGAIQETVTVSKDVGKYLKRVGDSFVLEGTQEVIPGIVPKPPKVTGTRLVGCKPDVVMPALNALPGGIAGVLTGGIDDE